MSCANAVRAIKTKESKLLSLNDFLEKAKNCHGDLYDYSESRYKGMLSKIKIICKIHGPFYQAAHSHVSNLGCSRCSKNSVSKLEKLWLSELNIDDNYRQFPIKINNKTYKVDGYLPLTNTIYEFYGDFWHGNPKLYPKNKINPLLHLTMEQLYNKTMMREQMFMSAGYKIISIWEHDYLEIIKRKRGVE